ncbi:hypothetical protein AFL01nite_16320 [Aeromicrobium flavum]|uniref:Mycothiol-dependent maleylpyruvate isomerase metal-binding domain-containing protein n=1 Tax=Aeromicrobium flavum TaxID=416568 RepID=A0A512HV44_9ACTN|nr:maleylpyruvate isomerase family mycothiol-dependent enzyme [Aeromicrobium flavum]GEO89305.1 hypothetical protein AFL01nite_16320 [Aeromicrobium flavum]
MGNVMDHDEIWAEIDHGKTRLAALLDELTPEQWRTPSLCEAWTVRDVAAHLAIAPTISLRRTVREAVRARGDFDRMIRVTAIERAAARTDAQILADLRDTTGARRLAPSTFVRDPLLDVLVHTQDIARPLGREVTAPADPALEALEWTWRRGFPFWPGRRFRGRRLVATDADWTRGRGVDLVAPAGDLLLMATGRLPVPAG